MKKVLLFGYSDFAKRVILPAAAGIPELSIVGVASKTRYRQIPHTIQAFRSYERAIVASGADTVYISLHNSAHAKWILFALGHGLNVICDKPAFLTSREARVAARLAQKHRLFLIESLPFLYHRQHNELKARLGRSSAKKLTLSIHFGFPALPTENFRNNPRLGGGCIADIGPYLVATGQYYTGRYPSVVFSAGSVNTRGIIDHAMVIMQYEGGGHTLMGDIGFGRTYDAHMELWGKSLLVHVNRPFATKPNEANTIIFRTQNRQTTIPIPPDNAMVNFLVNCARGKKRRALISPNIVSQAVALEAIRRSFFLQKPVVPNYEI